VRDLFRYDGPARAIQKAARGKLGKKAALQKRMDLRKAEVAYCDNMRWKNTAELALPAWVNLPTFYRISQMHPSSNAAVRTQPFQPPTK